MTTLKNPASESWQDPQKQLSRQIISQSMTHILKVNKFPKTINSLSLPAHMWFFEVVLAASNLARNFIFTGLEKNEEVLENQIGESIKLNRCFPNASFIPYSTTMPVDIETYLRMNTFLKYEIVYFDFMGNWSKEKEEWLENIFISNGAKQYILAFTTSVIRTHPTNQEKLEDYAELISKDLYKSRLNLGALSEDSNSRNLYFYGVNGFIYKLAKKYKKEVKIQTPIEYRNKNGRLQIVFLYHIVN